MDGLRLPADFFVKACIVNAAKAGQGDKVIKEDGSEIDFTYDAAGNRISKKVKNAAEDRTTWYVRDASGNVMSIYEKDAAGFWLTEQPIYGSDRLGMRSTMINLAEESSLTTIDHSFGQKQYELKNHLGNVLAVVSDRKDQDGNAVVLSANDYYPFGMNMPGRTVANTVQTVPPISVL